MKLTTSLTVIVTALQLTGCVSQSYLDTTASNTTLHKQMTAYTTPPDNTKVKHIAMAPVSILPLTQQVTIPWLSTPVSLAVTDMALSGVISRIMADTDVNIAFDAGINPNQRVSLVFKGTRGDILDALAKQLDYGIHSEPNKLTLRAFEAETFSITLPVGNYTGQLGSQGTQAESTGETGSSPRIEGQYLNVTYDNVDVFKDVGDGIRAILSNDGKNDDINGQVQVLPSLSIVNVRTSPSRMKQVRSFVSSYQKELSKQAVLDIQVLEFSSNLGEERSIDWNLIKDIGQGSLQFFVPGTTTVSQGAGYGLAFQGTGKWDGTTAFIRALRKQGTVSEKTPITGMFLNNQPGKISQMTMTPFLSEITTEANDNVVSTSVKRDKVLTGVDMMVTPKVEDNYVWLRLAGKLSKITGDEKEQVNEIGLRFITTQDSEFTFANKLRYGQTYVIASVKQERALAEKTQNFWMNWLGGQGVSHTTVETLVLLTPRRSE